MKKAIALITICLLFCFAASIKLHHEPGKPSNDNIEDVFGQFVQDFDRTYKGAEYA